MAPGRDHLEYLLHLSGPARRIDLTKGGVEDDANYDSPIADHPIETGRLAHCALTNAIFAATGKRIRELPIAHHDLKA